MTFKHLVVALLASSTTLAVLQNHEQQSLSATEYSSSDSIVDALTDASIIPEVIDAFEPLYDLSVMWGYYTRAALGNTLYPSWLQNPPRINLSPLPVDEQSVVSMQHATNLIITLSDPDAPSRSDPKWSEFCHWIAYDVPLPEASPSDPMLTPIDLVSYKPPGPPVGTGKHRYVFIAFAPKNGTDKPLTLSVPFDRKHWGWGQSRVGVQKWAKENGLFPVAANFVYAQNEHY